MTQRVKVIQENSSTALQNHINRFLEQTADIELIDIKYSMAILPNFVTYSVIIIYKKAI